MNLFCSAEDMNFFVFCGLAVAGTMKKEMSEKKRVSGSWVGYCPFLNLGHDNVHRIVTQQGHQATIRQSGCMLGRLARLRYG